ncbi:MAG: hypothetical protein AAGA48_22265 [Myxococcota bacterium]
MGTHNRIWLALPILVACTGQPPAGTQIGALRVEEPPEPPSDFKELDLRAAVEQAFDIAGRTTLATAWAGHRATMAEGTYNCPNVWLGAPPERLANLDVGDDEILPGLAWADQCQNPGENTFRGFTYWETTVDIDTGVGDRLLIGDARVVDDNDQVLFEYDGEAADGLTGSDYESDVVVRKLSGSLVGGDVAAGLRGQLAAAWATDGDIDLTLEGAVHLQSGFGPADTRALDLKVSPELANLPFWEPGLPRYTSVRFDLEFDNDCALEPLGYVGVRGNEGFWFDVYFLPKYDREEDPARGGAFPFEEIDNVECDGIGTAFIRNLSLKQADEEDPNWSREIQFDFAAILAALPRPAIEDFLFPLQELPTQDPTEAQ